MQLFGLQFGRASAAAAARRPLHGVETARATNATRPLPDRRASRIKLPARNLPAQDLSTNRVFTKEAPPALVHCESLSPFFVIAYISTNMGAARTVSVIEPSQRRICVRTATRLQQVSEDSLNLNQGTLYPALARLEQQGWIAGTWGKTENNREAKYYAITKDGEGALADETKRWRRLSGLVEKLLLVEES